MFSSEQMQWYESLTIDYNFLSVLEMITGLVDIGLVVCGFSLSSGLSGAIMDMDCGI